MRGRIPAGDAVAIVIAVKDGERFVARAVESALSQPEAGEVWVIDDGSSDATVAVAQACDDGSERLRIVSLGVNRGPSAARNVALERTACPYVTILDADDFMLPRRLERMLGAGGNDWDLLADDLIMLPETLAAEFGDTLDARLSAAVEAADLPPAVVAPEEFIESNLGLPGKPRKEYGFLKPILRVEFLRRHGLRYDETLRLGEDYKLYANALIVGARFKVIRPCGYVAIMRSNSLSREHATADHGRLIEADSHLMRIAAGNARIVMALRRHQRHTSLKYEHRRMLDDARQRGRLRAASRYLLRPFTASYILSETVRLKTNTRLAHTGLPPTVQFLVSDQPVRIDLPTAEVQARASREPCRETLTHAER